MVGTHPSECSISVPLPVGAKVILSKEYDIDEGENGEALGYTCQPFYEATVEQHVPETALIRMSDGTERAELIEKINKADGVEVITNYE